jgi:pimeloyl-ACP methyl ester carboxylesterase
MSETPIQFGRDHRLYGILTEPTGNVRRQIGVIFLNAGVVHHVGPHRAYVKLARHVATMGIPALRFDFSGVGDSRRSDDGASFEEQTIRDARSAMDIFERLTGVRRFILVGICSGANNAFTVAQRDARVDGLLLIDGHAYPTARTLIERMRQRFQYDARRAATTRLRRYLHRLLHWGEHQSTSTASNQSAQPLGFVSRPSRKLYAQQMQALVDRGVQVHLVYSGSILETYSYADQFSERFRKEAFLGRVQCTYDPGIDHTLTTLDAQQRLFSLATTWLGGWPEPVINAVRPRPTKAAMRTERAPAEQQHPQHDWHPA